MKKIRKLKKYKKQKYESSTNQFVVLFNKGIAKALNNIELREWTSKINKP